MSSRSPRSALITGIAGQDGVLLARYLVGRGYRVVGTRQPNLPYTFEPYLSEALVVEHDLVDAEGFVELLRDHAPDEVYNLAGLSSVGLSWHEPERTLEVNAVAVERMVDSIRCARRPPRLFQASSAEVFGPDAVNPQTEDTPHRPEGPYAESKSRAHAAIDAARDSGLFACVGILYNHESLLRPPHFVSRKITRAAAEIATGRRETLELGNVDIARDWGSAREYVVAMHAALAHDEPGDYIMATGQTHTVRELVDAAFAAAGVDDVWSRVIQDPELMRHADALARVGDPSRAREILGWQATQSFPDLVREMVEADLQRLASGVEESPDYLHRGSDTEKRDTTER